MCSYLFGFVPETLYFLHIARTLERTDDIGVERRVTVVMGGVVGVRVGSHINV